VGCIGNSLLCVTAVMCAAVRFIVRSGAWDKGEGSLEDTAQQVDSGIAA
jgi:hypothetical protein